MVEDHPGDAQLIRELLVRPAIEDRVLHVQTFEDALRMLSEVKPDAVLLDLGLPDTGGLDCISRLRTVASELPIVVLTGREDEALATSCIEAGAQDCLFKREMHGENVRRAVGYAIARVRETAERRRAESLQRLLAAVVHGSADAIVGTTPDGVVTSWNSGAEAIFGYSTAEAIGQSAIDVMPAADPAERETQRARLCDWQRGVVPQVPEEIVRLRRDGVPLTLWAVTLALRGSDGVVTGLAAILRDITERQRFERELRTKNDELVVRDQQMRALTLRTNAIREEERTRIAREVHDELGQLLTELKLDLGWIERHLAREAPAIPARLAASAQLVDRLAVTVQQIAIELRPSALDTLGLAAAIRDEARRIQAKTSIAMKLAVDDHPDIAPAVATSLFRIFQELMTNIVRHARARSVNIELTRSDGAWVLRVDDDGVGIADGEDRRPSSLGVLGMRERAAALGGTLVLAGRAVHGTSAQVRIPIAPERTIS